MNNIGCNFEREYREMDKTKLELPKVGRLTMWLKDKKPIKWSIISAVGYRIKKIDWEKVLFFLPLIIWFIIGFYWMFLILR